MGESWAASKGISGGGAIAHQLGGIGDDILRRRRQVVGDVEDAAGRGSRSSCQSAPAMSSTWMRLNTCPGLTSRLARAVGEIDQGVAARTVNAGQAQHRAPAGRLASPSASQRLLGRDPQHRARATPAGIGSPRRPRRRHGRHRRRRWRDRRSRPARGSPPDRARAALRTGSPASPGATETIRCVVLGRASAPIPASADAPSNSNGSMPARRKRVELVRRARSCRKSPASLSARGKGAAGIAGAEDQKPLSCGRALAGTRSGRRAAIRRAPRASASVAAGALPARRTGGRHQPRQRPYSRAAHQRRGVVEKRAPAPGHSDVSPELPAAISTLRTKRSRPMRLIGEPANSARKPASSRRSEFGERRRARDRRAPQARLAARLRELVPRADRKAVVAAIDAVADRAPELPRDRPLVLDGEIGDAAPRIEPVGRRKGLGRADVEAGAAGAAMVVARRIRRQDRPW